MDYTITNEQLEQLVRIYNTLCTISTKGEDTIIMAACLQTFKESIEGVTNNNNTIEFQE